jgi:hypothetical protein
LNKLSKGFLLKDSFYWFLAAFKYKIIGKLGENYINLRLCAKHIIFAFDYEIFNFLIQGTFFGIWICAFYSSNVIAVSVCGHRFLFWKNKRG